jgi:hypothetical protein
MDTGLSKKHASQQQFICKLNNFKMLKTSSISTSNQTGSFSLQKSCMVQKCINWRLIPQKNDFIFQGQQPQRFNNFFITTESLIEPIESAVTIMAFIYRHRFCTLPVSVEAGVRVPYSG